MGKSTKTKGVHFEKEVIELLKWVYIVVKM